MKRDKKIEIKDTKHAGMELITNDDALPFWRAGFVRVMRNSIFCVTRLASGATQSLALHERKKTST
jgi:hypothetical protein